MHAALLATVKPSPDRTGLKNLAMAVGLLAYAGVSYIALVLTSMVAPVPLAWIVIGAALAIALVATTWIWRRHRERMILLPLVGVAVWAAVIALAGWLFGWTA